MRGFCNLSGHLNNVADTRQLYRTLSRSTTGPRGRGQDTLLQRRKRFFFSSQPRLGGLRSFRLFSSLLSSLVKIRGSYMGRLAFRGGCTFEGPPPLFSFLHHRISIRGDSKVDTFIQGRLRITRRTLLESYTSTTDRYVIDNFRHLLHVTILYISSLCTSILSHEDKCLYLVRSFCITMSN